MVPLRYVIFASDQLIFTNTLVKTYADNTMDLIKNVKKQRIIGPVV